MALRFMDGFDHYGTGNTFPPRKWDAGACWNLSTGRTGLGINLYYNDYLTKFLPASDVFVIGFAVRFPANLATTDALVYWHEGLTNHVNLKTDALGNLIVRRDATVLATSTSPVFAPSAWYYVEMKVVIHDTTGSVEVRIDEVPVTFGSSLVNVDTKNGLTGAVDRLVLNGNSAFIAFDDLYVCDDSGSTNNDFLGICVVETLLPETGAGTHQDFTPSTGSDHGALVDDNPPNEDTDYNSSTTVGHQDSYTYPSLALTGTILGIQTNLFTKKSDVGARTVAPIVRTGGTTTPGTSIIPFTYYRYFPQVWETKPASGAWTEAEINALEVGMKIIS